MQTYGLLTALFFSLVSTVTLAAAPLPLSGTYKFQGEILSGPVADFRIVYTFTDAGKVELKDLLSQGYGCEARPRETVLCKKFLNDNNIPDEVKQRVAARFENYSVEFLNHAPEAPDTPENTAPDLKEWRIMQKVRIGETYYPFYRYQIISDSAHKIALGESGDSTAPYFVVRASNQVGVATSLSQKNAKGYRQYYVEAVLKN